MSSGSRQYNASFGTKTKTLKIRLSVSNLSVVLEDRVLTTKPVNLPLTPAVTLSLEITNQNNEESSKITVRPCFKNNSQEDKTIFIKEAITMDYSSLISSHHESKSYSKSLVKANSSLSHHKEFCLDKDKWVKNDSITMVIHFEEVVLCESQQNFIEDDTEEKTPDFFTSLYSQDDFKDTKFVIGEQSLMVHKAIIANRSKVFRAMLTHDTKEKTEGVIEIRDASFVVFKSFVQYLYTNQINDDKMTEEMLYLADKYDVQCLRTKCEKIVCKSVDEPNAIDYLIKADAANFQSLKKRALEVISNNLSEIRKSEGFKQLSAHPQLLEEVYNVYFDQNEIIECNLKSAPVDDYKPLSMF